MTRISKLPPEIGQRLLPPWKFFYKNITSFYLNNISYKIAEYDDIVKKYKNIHKGKRCFILGNGPSINETNLDSIKDEITIGVNSIYNIGDFPIKYYCIVDKTALFRAHKAISNMDTILFLSGNASLQYLLKQKMYDKYFSNPPILTRYLGQIPTSKSYDHLGDLHIGVYGGCTVIGFAIQLAYYMGFNEIYLLGCDCDFSKGHHFDKSNVKTFFGEYGDEVAGWKDIFFSYNVVKKLAEDNGCKIYNATVGGKLEIFERKKLEEAVK